MAHVPIRPRYHDPDLPSGPPLVSGVVNTPIAAVNSRADTIPTVAAVAAPTAPVEQKGLLTSVYENKIFVLIIVVIIIIIALAAYVIFKKDDSEVPKPKPRRMPPQDNIANSANTTGGNTAPSAAVTTPQPVVTTPAKPDLANLLARGRAAAVGAGMGAGGAVDGAVGTGTDAETINTENLPQTEEPEFDDEKATNEILGLMEDDDEENTPPAPDQTSEAVVETDPAPVQSTGPVFDPAYCQTQVKNHQCRNKPGVSGKCHVHSK